MHGENSPNRRKPLTAFRRNFKQNPKEAETEVVLPHELVSPELDDLNGTGKRQERPLGSLQRPQQRSLYRSRQPNDLRKDIRFKVRNP